MAFDFSKQLKEPLKVVCRMNNEGASQNFISDISNNIDVFEQKFGQMMCLIYDNLVGQYLGVGMSCGLRQNAICASTWKPVSGPRDTTYFTKAILAPDGVVLAEPFFEYWRRWYHTRGTRRHTIHQIAALVWSCTGALSMAQDAISWAPPRARNDGLMQVMWRTAFQQGCAGVRPVSVSYTHLTLPTKA